MENGHTIAETQAYIKQAERIGLTAAERAAIKLYLSQHPDAGDLVQGSGGVRKVRFARRGTGKSGGVRVFTFYWRVDEPLYLLAVISKTKQANLSNEQINILASITKEIKNG